MNDGDINVSKHISKFSYKYLITRGSWSHWLYSQANCLKKDLWHYFYDCFIFPLPPSFLLSLCLFLFDSSDIPKIKDLYWLFNCQNPVRQHWIGAKRKIINTKPNWSHGNNRVVNCLNVSLVIIAIVLDFPSF